MFGMNKIRLYRALANAAAAGIGPARILRTTASREKDPELEAMAREIESGTMISDAMRRRPEKFPLWQTAVVAAGEASGQLDRTFTLIADSLERSRSFWMSLLPKAAYPVLLITFAPFALHSGMIMTQGAGAYLFKVVLSLLPVYALGYAVYLGFDRLKNRPDLLVRIPLAGGILRGNLAHYLGLLVSAGLSFGEAISLASRAAGLPEDHAGLAATREKWKTGATAREILAALSMFEPDELDLLETGELSGKLDKELHHLSETIHARNEAALQTFLYIAPAVLLILVGLLMVYKLIGFYGGRLETLTEMGL